MIATNKYFHACFQLSKKITFNVSYYILGSNKAPYFSTSADEFNRPKTDFSRCGQAQNDLLKGFPLAMNFYKSFDKYHLLDLTDSQYDEMMSALDKLKEKYNHIISDRDINFHNEKELSKMKVK